MQKINYTEFIEKNTIDCDISYRGGSLKVDISGLLTATSLRKIEEAGEVPHAGACQNYLGGGIAGRIVSARMFALDLLTAGDYKKYQKFSQEVIKYFHTINNGGGDEYMQENYSSLKQNQDLPVSGY